MPSGLEVNAQTFRKMSRRDLRNPGIQRFSKLGCTEEAPRGLVGLQIAGPHPSGQDSGSGETREFALPRTSRGRSMLLVWALHLENHGSNPTSSFHRWIHLVLENMYLPVITQLVNSRSLISNPLIPELTFWPTLFLLSKSDLQSWWYRRWV